MPHVEGLFARLLTDWSGPAGIIRSLSFSMRDQSCTDDILQVTGKVAKKYRSEAGDFLVDLEALNIGHALAPQAASATATMSLPSKTGIAATPLAPMARAVATQPKPDTPDFAKAMMGIIKRGSWNEANALTEHESLLWCEALEDWNPLYWDQNFAAKSAHGGIIAPPAMGWFFGAGAAVNLGLGYLRPGVQIPEPVRRGLTGLALQQALRPGLIADNTPFRIPGCAEAAMVLAKIDYFNPIRPGDKIRSEKALLNCSALKRTKVGEGHFIDFVNACYNQRNELNKAVTMTQFAYHT
jgi:acyl dehydratase